MNTISKLLAVIAASTALLFMAVPEAKAQDTYFKTGLLSTNASALTILKETATTTIGGPTTNRSGVKLFPGRPISVGVNFTGANSLTTNTVVLRFGLSLDGTNYTTLTNALTWTLYAHGTDNVKAVKVYTLSDVDNCRYFKLLSVQNVNADTGASIYLTNVTYSVGY